MTVKIVHGDCMQVIGSLEEESVDTILNDPPYGSTKLKWDQWPVGWPARARRVLKRTGSMWVFGSMKMFLERANEFEGWKMVQDVVWEKHNGSGFQADRFKRVHESAVQFIRDDADWAEVYKDPQYANDATARRIPRRRQPVHLGEIASMPYETEEGGPRMLRSVLYVRSEHGRAEHPTQKPVGIVQPLLLYSCPQGGMVLDCFGGSGTTAVAAARTGRSAILIEADPGFVAIAEKRAYSDLFHKAEVPA